MDDFPRIIQSKAFRTIPGIEYNRVLQEYNEQSLETGVMPVFYEIVIQENATWKSFCEKIYPLFVRHLRYKMINPEKPKGVIVSAFCQEQCYLLEGSVFLSMYSEIEKLSPETFRQKIQEWLKGI